MGPRERERMALKVYGAALLLMPIAAHSVTPHDIVSDCTCSFKQLGDLNRDVVKPVLSTLTETTRFFQFFRVHLCAECPHDLPPPLCASPECSVCECEEDEVPCDRSGLTYLSISQSISQSSPTTGCGAFQATELSGSYDAEGMWIEPPHLVSADEWSYVNLIDNPERWTGYNEEVGSNMIWEAVHNENSFLTLDADSSERALVQRLFTRMMNGLHSSISAHIASDYCLQHDKIGRCMRFGPSLPEFERRLHSVPSRIDDLYFLYLFVLQAVVKGKELLITHDYHLHDSAGLSTAEEAERIHSSFMQLLHKPEPQTSGTCPAVCEVTESMIDLQSVVANVDAHDVQTLQSTFRNITSVMDCVGCEKCRLWGKLQVQGVAAALRLVLPDPAHENDATLDRNDIVALVWLLNRLSESIQTVEDMTASLARNSVKASLIKATTGEGGESTLQLHNHTTKIYPHIETRI